MIDHKLPKAYDYPRNARALPAPFIQIRLLKLLTALGAGDKARLYRRCLPPRPPRTPPVTDAESVLFHPPLTPLPPAAAVPGWQRVHVQYPRRDTPEGRQRHNHRCACQKEKLSPRSELRRTQFPVNRQLNAALNKSCTRIRTTTLALRSPPALFLRWAPARSVARLASG